MSLIYVAVASPSAAPSAPLIVVQDPTLSQTIREQVRQSIQDAAQQARDQAQQMRDGGQQLREAQQQVREAEQQVREAQQNVRVAEQEVRAARRADQRGAANQSLTAARAQLSEAEGAVSAAQAQMLAAEAQFRMSSQMVHAIQIPSRMHQGIPPQAVDLAMGFFITCAVMVVGWPIARALGRRIERPRASAPAEIGVGDQLQRIEQAVDAMAVEVERISEAQRFMTKLQTGSVVER